MCDICLFHLYSGEEASGGGSLSVHSTSGVFINGCTFSGCHSTNAGGTVRVVGAGLGAVGGAKIQLNNSIITNSFTTAIDG